jgi:hypothetical protein
MKPIEFVTDNGSDYNMPFGQFAEALQQPIIITDGSKLYEVLSYYYNTMTKCMVLEIKKSKKS